MNIHNNIALSLKQYLLRSNMTREDFADNLGVAKSSLQSYLNGTGNPRADTIEQIADKLNITVAELISEEPYYLQDHSYHPALAKLVQDMMILLKDIDELSKDLEYIYTRR